MRVLGEKFIIIITKKLTPAKTHKPAQIPTSACRRWSTSHVPSRRRPRSPFTARAGRQGNISACQNLCSLSEKTLLHSLFALNFRNLFEYKTRKWNRAILSRSKETYWTYWCCIVVYPCSWFWKASTLNFITSGLFYLGAGS